MRRNWYIILALAVIFGAIIWYQAAANSRMRDANVEAIKQHRADAEASCNILKSRKASLRNVITALKAEIAERESRPGNRMPEPLEPSQPAELPPWHYSGRGSPDTALETLLWAAAFGEAETLAESIELADDAAAEAAAFLASLPLDTRALFPEEESLVGTLLASQIPDGIESTEVVRRHVESASEIVLYVNLSGPRRRAGETKLRFHYASGGWRLCVPAPIVAGLRYNLTGVSLLDAPPPRR